jgi:hypothetical protein
MAEGDGVMPTGDSGVTVVTVEVGGGGGADAVGPPVAGCGTAGIPWAGATVVTGRIRWQWTVVALAVLLAGCASSERPAPGALRPFERDGLWGYRTTSGEVVVAPHFEVAWDFTPGGVAPVVDEHGWAIIDRVGGVLLRPLVVDNGPDYPSEGLARFVADGKVGFFDPTTGVVAIPARFDFALPFAEGLAAFCAGCAEVREGEHRLLAGGAWGFVDRRGEVVIPARFAEAESFVGGTARVRLAGGWTKVDRAGAVVAEAPGR